MLIFITLALLMYDVYTHSNTISNILNLTLNYFQISIPQLKMGVKSVVFRGSVLFVIGVVFALVLNVLQAQSVVLSPAVLTNFFKSAWWVAPIFGTGSGE